MKITEILNEDMVIPQLAGDDKISIIKELTEFLQKKGVIKNAETLAQALMEREKLGSTGIGENVAIPHAKSEEASQIRTVFARSIDGVDFDALDQKPVNFICLVIAPSSSAGQHLKALARISRLLKSEQLREKVLQADSAEGIFSAIQEEDSKFI